MLISRRHCARVSKFDRYAAARSNTALAAADEKPQRAERLAAPQPLRQRQQKCPSANHRSTPRRRPTPSPRRAGPEPRASAASQLSNACPASDAQTAVDALEKAHPDCQRAVVVVTPERTKSKLVHRRRTIRLVRRQKDNQAPLYAVAPSKEAWPELWRKDAAEAARLLEDESDAGIAFREARAARIRCDVQISAKTDWADPTGEKAAKAEAEAKAEREAAEARRKKSSALPIGFGLEEEGPRGAVWRFQENVLEQEEEARTCCQ